MGQLFSLESPISHVLARIVDIFILNLVFIISCLPIITIGASTNALYSVLMKMIKNEEKSIVKSFFISFKANFFKSTIIWMITVLIGAIILLDFLFLGHLSGLIRFLFTGMAIIFGFVFLCVTAFIFPYTARYEDTIKKSILNSLLIGTSNVPSLLAILLMNSIFVFIILSSNLGFLSGLYFVTFGGFALLAYLNALIISKVFSKYEVFNR
ncbi:YesL family protein [Lederbergia lenta]|uniref:YesL family protein n=1 Tax=Lederbergia lenta TaxID=1467 RepID=UPI00203FD5EA|nr:YesL family protein [Lederbergia lenta]MCM3111954.1 YesL family protein [Lederbergia lenta]